MKTEMKSDVCTAVKRLLDLSNGTLNEVVDSFPTVLFAQGGWDGSYF